MVSSKPSALDNGPHGQVDGRTLARIADALNWPLMLVLPSGHLCFANLAARRQLQACRWLQADAGGRLSPTDPAARGAFEAALLAAAAGNSRVLLWWDAEETLYCWLRPLPAEELFTAEGGTAALPEGSAPVLLTLSQRAPGSGDVGALLSQDGPAT